MPANRRNFLNYQVLDQQLSADKLKEAAQDDDLKARASIFRELNEDGSVVGIAKEHSNDWKAQPKPVLVKKKVKRKVKKIVDSDLKYTEWYDPRLTRQERARLIKLAYRELRRVHRETEGASPVEDSTESDSSEEEIEEVIEQVQIYDQSGGQAGDKSKPETGTTAPAANGKTAKNLRTPSAKKSTSSPRSDSLYRSTSQRGTESNAVSKEQMNKADSHNKRAAPPGSQNNRTGQLSSTSSKKEKEKRGVTTPGGKKATSQSSNLGEKSNPALAWLAKLQKTRDKYGIEEMSVKS